MHTPRLALAVLPFLVSVLGCAGTTHISELPNTPPTRGERGPFVASFVWYPRVTAPPASLATTAGRAGGWLAEYQVANDEGAGTVTLWTDSAHERAFHDEAWLSRQQAANGAAPGVERFDVPVWIDNGHDAPSGGQMVVFVSLPLPWLHPRGIVEDRIMDRVPEYQAISALDRKYFTLMEPARFGGIYLWRDEESARNHFSRQWHEEAKTKYGAEGDVRFFRVVSVSKREAE